LETGAGKSAKILMEKLNDLRVFPDFAVIAGIRSSVRMLKYILASYTLFSEQDQDISY
jgi:hypothetical protein